MGWWGAVVRRMGGQAQELEASRALYCQKARSHQAVFQPAAARQGALTFSCPLQCGSLVRGCFPVNISEPSPPFLAYFIVRAQCIICTQIRVNGLLMLLVAVGYQ